MTWTVDSTHDWRDMSVIIGHNFETNRHFDRDSIETWRDLSFLFGQDCKATPCSDRSSIHAWRDMSVTKPPHETAVHHRSRLIFEKLTFIKNWKNGKVILDFELEKCTRDIFTLPRASVKRSGQCLNECDWIWLSGSTCLEVCC